MMELWSSGMMEEWMNESHLSFASLSFSGHSLRCHS